MDLKLKLQKLTEISAISGHEDRLIAYVVKEIGALGIEAHVDRLGNVSATFTGTEEDGSIAYFAHMDELGLIVKRIEEDGFLRVERIGGVPEKVLLSAMVDVHTVDDAKSYRGIVGTCSHHLTPPDQKLAVTPVGNLYIDLGLGSKSEVLERGIDIGSMVTYAPNFTAIGDRIVSKALDDRMGVYALLALGKYLKEHPPKATVHLIFSVQEEFNVRACLPAFERLMPDAAICIDISPACDTPELKGRYDMALGKGVAIMYMNFHGRGTLGGLLASPKLNQFIEQTAKQEKIALQREVVIGVITDDAFTQLAGTEGIAMGHLSIPLRYTHSPAEMADWKDITACIRLMCATASGFSSAIDLRRGI